MTCSYGERRDDIDNIPRYSMERLLIERSYVRQGWWADLLDAEISRRISMSLVPTRQKQNAQAPSE